MSCCPELEARLFITNHVLAGAAIGSRLPPERAAIAGFASHLAMDNLPHWGVVGYFPLTAAQRDGFSVSA